MESFINATFPHRPHWVGWRRWAIWGLCIGAVTVLGSAHSFTNANFAFSSLALFPVLADFSPVSASVGVAWFGHVDRSFSGMLTAADEVMYEVKKGGKNGMLAKRLSRTGAPDSQV